MSPLSPTAPSPQPHPLPNRALSPTAPSPQPRPLPTLLPPAPTSTRPRPLRPESCPPARSRPARRVAWQASGLPAADVRPDLVTAAHPATQARPEGSFVPERNWCPPRTERCRPRRPKADRVVHFRPRPSGWCSARGGDFPPRSNFGRPGSLGRGGCPGPGISPSGEWIGGSFRSVGGGRFRAASTASAGLGTGVRARVRVEPCPRDAPSPDMWGSPDRPGWGASLAVLHRQLLVRRESGWSCVSFRHRVLVRACRARDPKVARPAGPPIDDQWPPPTPATTGHR